METRANYVLIGAFALAGFFGILGFLLWFAQYELDRQFDYYDVRFSSVSGLSRASEVRFSGLPVGQVVDVRLAPERDGTVLVRLEVQGNTPVRTTSVATIESMGVTGVSYVGITSGDPGSPLLTAEEEGAIPRIEAGRSVLQSLTEDAPRIIEEAVSVLENVGQLLNEENQQKVQQILDNLAASSGDLSQALTEFSGVSRTIATATDDIASFTGKLDPVVIAVEDTLDNLDTTLGALTSLSGRIETSLDVADDALQSGRGALDAAETFMTGELQSLSQDLVATTQFVREQTETLVTDARGMVREFSAAGSAATQRLTEAEGTLRATDQAIDRLIGTMDTIEAASLSFDDLITKDGSALVSETRTMIENADRAVAAVNSVAETDLPAIVSDIREATGTVNRVVAEVGTRLTDATGKIDGLADDAATTMQQVTETFANANQTLAAIDQALVTGERSLEAAERAFSSADRVMNEDVEAITGDLRRVMQRLDGAIAQVSDDIPGITADLRDAAETANRAFEEVGQLVAQAGPSVQEFTGSGLPQYTRLAGETRALIDTLERIARQIERDPARFFLNRQTPEFRR
ncbi:MlaD family protein [Roseovarius sp. D22-M7]|uniref:MlaD family protein n=1 Tax=Roseovarius sp. D22-M7 TaxID=3127116 RepID=UPI00300FEBB6